MHEESVKWEKDEASVIKELVGKWLFFLYAIFYASFIFITISNPDFMRIDVGSINMAIAFGFGLIILAMLLAVAYNNISTRAEMLFAEIAERTLEKEKSDETE